MNISYAAQLVEDSLTLASSILPGQKSNDDRLYTLAYHRNELPLALARPNVQWDLTILMILQIPSLCKVTL